MAKPIPSLERIKRLLDYDPATGFFTWKMKRGPRSMGSRAGSLDKDGYRLINIDGCQYREHKLAVFYVTGEWPTGDVDHRFGERSDNRFLHLRNATRQQNSQNSRGHSDSKSGLKGAHFHPASGKWLSRIRIRGNNIYLGIFPTPSEAHYAYINRARAEFGDFFRA